MRQDCGDGTFFVEDSVGDLEQIPRMDIITDEDDADNVIKVRSHLQMIILGSINGFDAILAVCFNSKCTKLQNTFRPFHPDDIISLAFSNFKRL